MTEAPRPTSVVEVDLIDYAGPADHADLTVVDRCVGPVLDIGCGPGRMVRTLNSVGVHAAGIDLAVGAAAHARAAGAAVLARDVFARLPGEGLWASIVLIDGNIGIGGDPARLLARCAQLLRPGGSAVIEVEFDTSTDRRSLLQVKDIGGRHVLELPWATLGESALRRYAAPAGFTVVESWRTGGRSFVTLRAGAG